MPLNKSNQHIGAMFDSIAQKYDFLNHLISFNQDKKWRKKAVKQLLQYQPHKILDIATGTGDMLLEIAKNGNYELVGIDLSSNMLHIAQQKFYKLYPNYPIQFFLMPAEKLNFLKNDFDAITVAFGIRNFENLSTSLNNIYNVLKPKGKLLIIEFVKPHSFILRNFLFFYLKCVLPFIGQLLSQNKSAYTYLIDSIQNFYTTYELSNMVNKANFKLIFQKNYLFGLVAVLIFEK